MKFQKSIRGIIHPIFLGLYPVLFLTGNNLGEVEFKETWRAILMVLIVSIILWSFLRLVLRENRKAAMITTLLLLSFFSYGHLYNFLGQEEIFHGLLGRHRYLFPFFGIAILFGSWWVWKRARSLDVLTKTLNLTSLVLMIFPIFQITLFEIRSLSLRQENASENLLEKEMPIEPSIGYKPDIYYIILDAYSREDVLLELFGYDNSAFLHGLRDMGFYVADCSTSNYEKTIFSLASSLNMDYLDQLDGETLRGGPGSRPDVVKFRSLIKDNNVRRILESNGYSTVAFQTGFYWTSWDDADHYYSYSDSVSGKGAGTGFQPSLNEFEVLFMETTAGSLFFDFINTQEFVFEIEDGQSDANNASRQWITYNRVNYTLDSLEEIPTSVKSPKLVFAHIISPHGPFVFAENGDFLPNQRELKPGYVDQIKYLNQRVLKIAENILQSSEKPPIVIIQADHGSPKMNFTPLRLPILSAYYLPGDGDKHLYASITPVNNFRLVFDRYFGTNFGLLKDIARNSAEEDLFHFTIVSNQCKSD